MTKINLREHYPNYYKTDYIIEVPDKVAAIIIEYDALFVSMIPCEIYERKVTMEQLHAAIAKSEGVSVASVSESIPRELRNMETFLKNRL